MLKTFNNLTQIQKILITIIVGIVLYGASTVSAYNVFTNSKTSLQINNGTANADLPGTEGAVEPDAHLPKTEPCPLNGELKSSMAKEAWEKRRPLAVMIENHQESRPQSGLSSADMVYEAIAEGGITRFMAVFYCNLGDVQVGPVRSARTYFLDWASELDPLYAHVGGANTPGPADALGQIIKYKIKSLNQFSIGFPTYWRDYQRLGHPVATEHTMYSTTNKLWEIGTKRGWTNTDSAGVAWNKNFVPWKFKDPKQQPQPGQTNKIVFNFWDNQADYLVEWNFDPSCNCYKRKNGGVDHIDLNTKKQLQTKNIVIQFQKESRANDGYPNNLHMIYGTIGTGEALIFQDGNVIEGKWSKQSRTARSKYTDNAGKEVEFSPGAIWIHTVSSDTNVSY